MKKILMLLIVVIVPFILTSCGVANNKSDDNWADSFGKAEKVEVTSRNDSEIITFFSDEKKIKDFINKLQIDKWESKDVPSEATPGKVFKMYQRGTIKLGQRNSTKDEFNGIAVATMTIFENVPYLKFNLRHFSFNFKIPNDVHEYLNNFE